MEPEVAPPPRFGLDGDALGDAGDLAVVALISIDTDGTVANVSIERSAGADFGCAVIQAARRTRFQPPVRNGRKVPALFRRPFEFGLE